MIHRFPWRLLRAVSIACAFLLTGCMAQASPNTTAVWSQTPDLTEDEVPSATASPSGDQGPASGLVTLPGEGSGWDTVAAIARGADRYLALGWHYEPNPHVGYNGGARLWSSTDGVGWSATEVPAEFGLGPSVSLVATPSGDFLLFGNSYDSHNVLRPVVMRSSDGDSWEIEPVNLPKKLYLTRVVSGPKGYLLAGRDDGPGGLWLSPDGITWRSVHALEQTDTTYEVITDIGAGEDGFVAVGEAGVSGGDSLFFALASGDGQTWFRSDRPFPADEGYAGVAVVAPIGGDWVATGGWGGTLGRFWRSADGLNWERAGAIEPAPSGSGPILVSAGSQLFYSSWNVPVGQPGGWNSPDGVTWTSLDLGVGGSLAGAFYDSDGLLLLGSAPVSDDRADAAIWRP